MVVVNGTQSPAYFKVTGRAGKTIVLDGSASRDADDADMKGGLEFVWYQHKEPSTKYVRDESEESCGG